MNKESEDRIKDMVSLMDEGYGKDILSLNDILDTSLSVSHIGGVNAIVKSTKSWIGIIASLAQISIGIRMAVDMYAPDLDISEIKTSDMFSLDIRYMESSKEAGVRMKVEMRDTGNPRLNAIIESIMPVLLKEDTEVVNVL